MEITNGSRLGPYEIISRLGIGGLGEVWRARDTRLDRSVAVKVLPAELAANANFRARFEREAKTISQLNDPHICTLYDVGDGYLVMELIEGDTLAERIARGPLPLTDVLRFGAQIAGALNRAHAAGIVHRDLKPGNIMITKSGAKLLDFGLAKDGSIGVSADGATVQKALTQEGTILGTFQYMAPEQLEGTEADARTDIFALGAVLYEMATGRRAFSGKTKTSLIAAIVSSDPIPISELHPTAPTALDRIIRACMAKEPDERFQSAHDVAMELSWIASGDAGVTKRSGRSAPAWALAVFFLVIAAALGAAWWRQHAALRRVVPVRTSIEPPEGSAFDFKSAVGPPEISPDGTKIIFAATTKGERFLYIRDLSSSDARRLAATSGAQSPFWSYDGHSIGFFADGKLKRMEINGGAPVAICDAAEGRGGSWNAEGTIIYSERYTPVFRVPATGGVPVEITAPEHHDVTHRWPRFLPDGRHFLFYASPSGSDSPDNVICVGSLDTKMRKVIVAAASQPMYFDGHLLFTRDQTLIAQRFDDKALAVSGEPVTLEQHIAFDPIFSRAFVSVSREGTMVYQEGMPPRDSQLAITDRAGKVIQSVGDPAPYSTIAISPNGREVAFSNARIADLGVWKIDVGRGTKTRLTFAGVRNHGPQFSPDGTQVVYSSTRTRYADLYIYDTRTGTEHPLLITEYDKTPTCWSSDGQLVFYNAGRRTKAGTDIEYVSVADGKAHPYLATDAIESHASTSPDGKWVTYQSFESGNFQVYLAPLPWTGGKWQVSVTGGAVPHWSGDGKEILFQNSGALWTVPVRLGPTPDIGLPARLFAVRPNGVTNVLYAAMPDGQHFLINQGTGDDPPPQPLTLVQHFDSELRAAEDRHE